MGWQLMMRRIKFISLLLAMLVLSSCGNKLGDYTISIGGEVIEKDDNIIVKGESNLLPGSRLTGKVIVEDGEVLSETTEVVGKNGKFDMELEHHQYGDATVSVTFSFDGMQEEEITEHYGENGEKLEGPLVYVDEHWGEMQQKAVITAPISQDQDSSKHPFTVPVWNELPEDYGDPRVWIEVDEITTDEEYFYLYGRTNLLEGSKLVGDYAGKRQEDETRVNPDGTFEMKIKYKYEEDKPFILQFKPSSQWKSISEAYGENGEKLVGKFVEASGKTLYIETVIPYEN